MNRLNNSVGILGLGSYLPEKILTNFDLEKIVDTSNDWIIKRTGISERRVLEKHEPAFEIGIKASQRAIEEAGIRGEDLDLIIVTTETPDYLAPSTACIIQGKIGAVNAAAFDLNAACSGFIYGLSVAQQFISTGHYKYILVVAVEALTKIVDWEDRNTCVLFGDGAGAAVLGPVEEGYGLLGTYLGADGTIGHNITIPCCYIAEEDLEKRLHENKHVLWMDGSEVFKFAVRVMEHATLEVLKKANMELNDIQLIFPHQANVRIIEGAVKRLGVSNDRVIVNVEKYGNISSASIPVALDQALKNKNLAKGDNILLVGFGGGLTWASAIIKWAK